MDNGIAGGKLLILLGVTLVVLGVLWLLAEKIGLGQLPGDLLFRSKNFAIYFPLATCLVLSALLSLVLWLLHWWRR